ncbi:tetratricopeptide repeat protein [Caminibacter sp.]
MAEEKEHVVVIEEADEKKSKLPLIIIILLLLVLILLLILLAVVVIKKKKETMPNENIEQLVKKLEKKNIPKDELNLLIKKATILYKTGQKEKALQILQKISEFSKALSYYNLGVIKIEEKDYKTALSYFQKAIQNKENRTISAINAAYCALKLKNYRLFDYYRKLAYTFLPEISKNKNYPYYYAVVMYYLGYEYETIQALHKKTAFVESSKKLLGDVYDYYQDPDNAVKYIQTPLFLGFNYAKTGKYFLAKEEFSKTSSKQGQFALALVDLKISDFQEAAKILKKFKNENIYPITVFLKKSLFDIKTAQKEFQKTFLKKITDYYDLFFYFAPYKVYNIKQTINYLKKGIAGIPIGSIEESQNYLKKSAVYSTLNLKISKAIRLALNGHIYLANREFLKLLKNHSTYILHYDTAVTYAQLGDYLNAYKHFLRAYHLNPYDLKTGILALYAAKKANIQNTHLVTAIKEDLSDNTDLEDAMLSLYTNNRIKMVAFLQKPPKNKPFWILTRLTIKGIYNRDFSIEATALKNIFEKDLIANLLYFYANNKNLPINKLAQNYQSFFLNMQNYVNLNDFYYGSKLSEDWYFEFARISGLIYRVRLQLLKKVETETFDVIPPLKRLAYADFYTKHFEESYTIYNDLINNKNVDDPHTLYYAAVAAIGANHHANAVALMELAKLKNPNYLEPRFGLGLLWQEANNLEAASIQYLKIDNGFVSKFFDFNLKPKN